MTNQRLLLALVVLASFVLPASLGAATPAGNLRKKPDEWFRSDEGRRTLENILSWQTEHGDWPKNTDTTSKSSSGHGKKPAGTFDNGATSGELRALARASRITGNEHYEQAFLRGFDHILKAQYPNGGWPQFYPLSKEYHRHITFNDGTMIRLMEFLREATSGTDYAFLDQDRRDAAKTAVERGVGCIMECQVVVDGTPTVWCAQHHAETLAPVQARSYEHASLSGAESAGILMFLMSLEKPTPEVIRAVKTGAAWFDSAKIEGYRYRKSRTEPALVKDPTAAPLWARFYEIKSNRPIFSDRDGVVKYNIEEIGGERRRGYAWYGNWGDRVARGFAQWPYR
jgi:pectate lyase